MDKQGIFYDVFDTTEKEWDAENWRERGFKLNKQNGKGEWYISQRNWAIGDWLLAGNKHFKVRKLRAEAEKITGNSWGTLKNFMWVAKEFPKKGDDPKKSRRRDNLPWSHHREVVKLPSEKQDELLDQCVGENGRIETLKWLRSEIRKGRPTRHLRVTEMLAESEAIQRGEFPLHLEPIRITFTEKNSAVLQYLFKSEKAVHGQKDIEDFLIWLTKEGMKSAGWMPKVEEFVVNRKSQIKARQVDVEKRDAEAEARRVAAEADFKARKAAWEQSRRGTSNQTSNQT